MPFFIIGSINIFVSNNFSQIFWLKVPSCPIWKLWYTFQTTKITSLTFSTFFLQWLFHDIHDECNQWVSPNFCSFVSVGEQILKWRRKGWETGYTFGFKSQSAQYDLTNLSNIYIRYPSPPRSHFIIQCSSKLRLGHTMEFKVGTLRRDP